MDSESDLDIDAAVAPEVPGSSPAAPLQPTLSEVQALLGECTQRPLSSCGPWMAFLIAYSVLLAFLVGMTLVGPLALAGLLCALCLSVAAFDRSVAVRRGRKLAEEIGPEWIGPLLQCLHEPNALKRTVASTILTRLLHSVRGYDPHHLTDAQRRCLHRSLAPRKGRGHAKLTVAILNALPSFGTDADLRYVRRLATAGALLPGARRVRAAARRTLPALEAATVSTVSTRRTKRPEKQTHIEQPIARDAVQLITNALSPPPPTPEKPGMRMEYYFATLLTITPFCGLEAYKAFHAGDTLIGLSWAIASVFSTQLHRITLGARHISEAKRLTQTRDPRNAGALAAMLHWPDPQLLEIAATSLSEILPTIGSSQRTILTAKNRRDLAQFLTIENVEPHLDLMLTILETIERLEDLSAIPDVERLAASRADTPLQAQAVDAAIDCLASLLLAAQTGRGGETLLRPAGPAGICGETLLRPAEATAGADTHDLLLRPHNRQVDRRAERDLQQSAFPVAANSVVRDNDAAETAEPRDEQPANREGLASGSAAPRNASGGLPIDSAEQLDLRVTLRAGNNPEQLG